MKRYIPYILLTEHPDTYFYIRRKSRTNYHKSRANDDQSPHASPYYYFCNCYIQNAIQTLLCKHDVFQTLRFSNYYVIQNSVSTTLFPISDVSTFCMYISIDILNYVSLCHEINLTYVSLMSMLSQEDWTVLEICRESELLCLAIRPTRPHISHNLTPELHTMHAIN